MASTWTESVWDDHERALVDAWQDWRNGLHKCGFPRSEAFRVQGRPDPEATAAVFECVYCEAVEREQARRANVDKKLREDGINPDAWREYQAMRLADALALQAAQQGQLDN